VVGEAGEIGPVIAILGEYDALPGLSQEAGVAEPRPLPGSGHGHGCGHNILGSASLLAATAVKDFLAAHGIKGRVRYYGCPAEEGGAAKGFMVRAGVFSDVDVAITWHPSAFSGVYEPVSLANTRIDFAFTGRAAHAAAAPHLGRSALDAVELMNVGANYMREHMPSDARVHYALLDAGGIAPNVVQANAKVRYLIRARNLPELTRLIERVRKIADGAALMTETAVQVQVVSAVSNLLGNTPLEKAMHDNLLRLGPPPFDEADRHFARKIQAMLTEEDIESAFRRAGMPIKDVPLCDEIVPLDAKSAPMMFDRCRRCELGGADGAGAWCDLCDRHAGPLVAADGAGQDGGGAQGSCARREGNGVHGGGCVAGRRAAGARQGRSSGARGAHALCLPVAARTGSAAQDVRVRNSHSLELVSRAQPSGHSELHQEVRNRALTRRYSGGRRTRKIAPKETFPARSGNGKVGW
jgi:amidohydrolase